MSDEPEVDIRTQPAPQGSSREKLLWDLLALHNTNRIDYNNRKWETLKFFQTIVSALLAATVAAILTIYGKPVAMPIWLFIAILPSVATIASYLAIHNLRRESRLLFLEEVQMFKIAKVLGLDQEIAEDRRWLPKDNHLLHEKWRTHLYATGVANPENIDEWLRARMEGHRFVDIFVLLFGFQIVAAFGLAAVVFHYARGGA